MRRGLVWLLGIYAFILLLVSGVVAPLVYVLMQHLASVTSLEWVNYLAHKPLCQYVDRFRMVGFFCMLPYVCKISGIRLRDLGIRFNIWKYLLAFCGGCLLWVGLFLVFVIKVDGISRRLNTVNSLLVIFLAAFFLAIVEEVVFRGVIFEFLKKKYTKSTSLLLLACIFACLHFSFCEPAIAKNVFIQSLLCAYYSIVDIFVHIRWPYFCCLFLLLLQF